MLSMLNMLDTSLLSHAHVGGKGGVRNPFGGVTWGSLFQHAVDLLKGKTLGFGNKEISIDEATCAEGTPEEEDLSTQVCLALFGTDEVRSDNGNDTVPEPVGGGGESNTTGSDWERENFTDDNPSSRSPSGGEERDVDTNECDHGGNGRGVVFRFATSSNTDDGNDELAD